MIYSRDGRKQEFCIKVIFSISLHYQGPIGHIIKQIWNGPELDSLAGFWQKDKPPGRSRSSSRIFTWLVCLIYTVRPEINIKNLKDNKHTPWSPEGFCSCAGIIFRWLGTCIPARGRTKFGVGCWGRVFAILGLTLIRPIWIGTVDASFGSLM